MKMNPQSQSRSASSPTWVVPKGVPQAWFPLLTIPTWQGEKEEDPHMYLLRVSHNLQMRVEQQVPDPQDRTNLLEMARGLLEPQELLEMDPDPDQVVNNLLGAELVDRYLKAELLPNPVQLRPLKKAEAAQVDKASLPDLLLNLLETASLEERGSLG